MSRRFDVIALAGAIAITINSISIAIPRAARAQTPPAAAPADAPDPKLDPKVEEARDAFRIGSTLAKQAQWVDALSAFERSARLRPHAVTTYNIGYCERALGRFTRAKKSLARALAAPGNELPADLSGEAKGYLAEIENRFARAVITLAKAGASVSVDGRPLEASGGTAAHPTLVAGTRDPGPAEAVAAGSFDLILDPGTHVIVVSVSGSADAVVTREFAAGATVSLTLGPTAPASAPAVPAPPRSSGNSGARRAGVIVSFAAGGAFAIAGATFGGLALTQKSQLDGLCKPKDACPSSAQGTIDSLKLFSNLSTVGIAAAVAGAGLGTVLLLTGDSSAKPSASAWVGPGSFGIRGTF